jgi:hypothetical protein
MHGRAGSPRRRRLITAEFILGTVGLALVASLLLAHGSTVLGLAVAGIGLNYACFMLCAIQLYPAGRLEAEVAGRDLRAEAKRYGLAQLLLLVPGLVFIAFIGETLITARS